MLSSTLSAVLLQILFSLADAEKDPCLTHPVLVGI